MQSGVGIRNGHAWSALIASMCVLLPTLVVAAEPGAASGAEEMARKLQNPLANIRALMTDNAIAFDTGDDEGTSYGFQLQPVYAIDFPDQGFTFIPRAVIPIVGLEPGTDIPPVGIDGRGTPSGGSSVWGLGDSMVQFFFAPHVESAWKWGIGPQFSLATHTQDELRGAYWGAGLAAVVTGPITDEVSFAGILGNHWSFDGRFNTMTIQPMVYYNLPGMPGAAISYNAVISADWEASGGDRWTVPIGLTFSKTFDMGRGHGLDVGAGPYYNVVRPDGGARWQIRFGMTWLFP